LIIPGQRLPIVIATRPVDFRRDHDGLAATVQNELGLDPHSGLTVVFRSKRGDRVKILVWDGTDTENLLGAIRQDAERDVEHHPHHLVLAA
jgi:transposase